MNKAVRVKGHWKRVNGKKVWVKGYIKNGGWTYSSQNIVIGEKPVVGYIKGKNNSIQVWPRSKGKAEILRSTQSGVRSMGIYKSRNIAMKRMKKFVKDNP